VLRQIYIRQGLGVGQLRMKFGGLNKRSGAKPEHFAKSSGGLMRHIMQQFESVGFVEKHTGEAGGGEVRGGAWLWGVGLGGVRIGEVWSGGGWMGGMWLGGVWMGGVWMCRGG
jgi:hypothetical protein